MNPSAVSSPLTSKNKITTFYLFIYSPKLFRWFQISDRHALFPICSSGVAATRCTSVGVPPARVPFRDADPVVGSCTREHGRGDGRGVRAQQLSEQTQTATLGYRLRLSDVDLSLFFSLLRVRVEHQKQRRRRQRSAATSRGENSTESGSSQLAWANLPERHGDQTFLVIG